MTTRVGETGRPAQVLGHVPAFDGLRGLAVLMVLYHHVVTTLIPGVVQPQPVGFIQGGFLGVDVFFVLSGFLITALLLSEHGSRGRVHLGGFYVRRALRLFPALYVLLAVHLVYAWRADLPMDASVNAAGMGFVYLSNWMWRWQLSAPVDLGHLWSLAIEEQFYLVWPIVLIVLLRPRHTWFLTGTTVAAIALIAIHRLVLIEQGEPAFFLYMRTDTRADSLLVGALAAQLWSRGLVPKRGLRVAGVLAAAALGACAITLDWLDPFLYRGGFTLVAMLVAVMLLALVGDGWAATSLLALPPLRAVGRVSYGVYLWHLPVFVAIGRVGTTWGWEVRVVVGLVGTMVVTLLSWWLVERPALRLKRRWDARIVALRDPPPSDPAPPAAPPPEALDPVLPLPDPLPGTGV